MMNRIRKAIIPAAGKGTRLAPLTDYLPKPMLPLGRKPVLQYIVEELKEAGISEILLVVPPEQEMVVNYFSKFDGISFATDTSFGGPGRAVLAGEPFIDDETFLVVFADAPLAERTKGTTLGRLITSWEPQAMDLLLSVYEIPTAEVSFRGIVELKDESESTGIKQVKRMLEKPVPEVVQGSRHWASACRYIVTTDIFRALESVKADKDGELQLTDGINHLLQQGGNVFGLPIADEVKRYDTGTFEGYYEAVKTFT